MNTVNQVDTGFAEPEWEHFQYKLVVRQVLSFVDRYFIVRVDANPLFF